MPVRASFISMIIPAIVGALVSLVFAWTGVLSVFTLIPIAAVGFLFSAGAALLSSAFVIIITGGASVLLFSSGASSVHISAPFLFLSIAYMTVLFSAFAWAVPYRGLNGSSRKISVALRLSIVALVSTALIIPLFSLSRSDPDLLHFFKSQIQLFIDATKAASASDAVTSSLLETQLTPDRILDEVFSILIRGGALAFHLVFFTVSWRFGMAIASFKRPELRKRGSFLRFRNHFSLVWILILALLLILAGNLSKQDIPEIIGMNLLVFSALLFAAQGYGIYQYNLMRPQVPRFLLPVGIFMLLIALFSPGISVYVIVALAIVGVAENWLPLRAPISNEPTSTPGSSL